MIFFVAGNNKLISRFIWKCKRLSIAGTILKDNKIGGPDFFNLKTNYKAIVSKTVQYWCSDRSRELIIQK